MLFGIDCDYVRHIRALSFRIMELSSDVDNAILSDNIEENAKMIFRATQRLLEHEEE